MPKNLRPSTLWTGNGWEDKSFADIEIAQTQWDLAKAQEQANEIALKQIQQEEEKEQRRLMQERENAIIQAKAIVKAEKERHQHELELEKQRQEHDKMMRYYKICDDIGINYDDILQFEEILKLKIPQNINNITEKINNKKESIKNLKLKKPTLELYTQGVQRQVDYLQEKVRTKKKEYNKRSAIGKIFGSKKKKEIEEFEEDLEHVNNKLKKATDNFYKNEEKLLKDFNIKLEDLELDLKSLEEELENAKKEFADKSEKMLKDFYELRTNHYNYDVEMLFEKLEIKLPKVEIKEEGSAKEYSKFIKNIIDKFYCNA